MKAITELLHCDGCTTQRAYLRNLLLLVTGKAAIDLLVMPLRPDLFSSWSWAAAWINPFLLIEPWMNGDIPLIVCVSTFTFYTAVVWNSVHRARHAGIAHWSGLLTAVPFVNVVILALLLVAPARKRPSVLDLPSRW